MKLATYNVENMYDRPIAMNLDTWADGKQVLTDFEKLNELIQEPVYTPEIKSDLLDRMKRNKGLLTTGESKYIILRDNAGGFLSKPKNKPVQIAANGGGDWRGWFELIEEAVNETATVNTGRIIEKLGADVQCIVEAEDRVALMHFNRNLLPTVGAAPFGHVMLIDGNDERGIDVAIMTRAACTITRMISHVDDADAAGLIFSRDCPEYEITTAKGNKLLVLVNHFKSKGYGSPSASDAKRTRQARQVRTIYDKRLAEGYKHIAIAGDLNAAPDEPALAPLRFADSGLTDIMSHAKFTGDGRPGTHANGTAAEKLDYILMSPDLSAKVTAGGVERRGVWGGTNGKLFPHLPEITKKIEAASDHAALWMEADI